MEQHELKPKPPAFECRTAPTQSNMSTLTKSMKQQLLDIGAKASANTGCGFIISMRRPRE